MKMRHDAQNAKRNTLFNLLITLGCVLLLGGGILMARQAQAQETGPLSSQDAVGATFTYQGRLLDNGVAVDGTCDFEFSLWTALEGGSQVAAQAANGVEVNDGYFSVPLNFGGNAFTGDARYLNIGVNCGSGSTLLEPRVALTAAPYAHSLRPGAVISGAVSNSLNVQTSAGGSASALLAQASSQTGQGIGVWGATASEEGGVAVLGRAEADSGTAYGVYGLSFSSGGTGVYGTAPTTGTAGIATAGSDTTYGVYGKANSSDGYGVYGVAGAPSGILPGLFGIGVGVWGDSADQPGLYGTSNNGTGVVGWSSNNPGVGGISTGSDGVQGTSINGAGVHGIAPITGTAGIATGSGTTYGIYGKATSLSGKGVYGEGGYYGVHGRGTDPTGTSYGVYGQTESTSVSSYGGYFMNNNNVGLYAKGKDTSSRTAGDIRLAGTWGVIAADESSNSSMSLLSNDDVVVYLDNDDNDASSCFSIYDPGDSAIVPIWEICHEGTAASIVDTEEYGAQKLYAMESTEVWVEDFGSGALVNGVATVDIDPIFAEMVDLNEYHVFLTPLGDCNGLYVAAKTSTSFEVRELGGGASNVSFDYRIVAHRLEEVR
jgi:hypothetical protein